MRALLVFLTGVFRRLTGVGLARTAAALSFTTILGLVPLMTVALVYVARYPLFERWIQSLERFLVRHLLPGSGTTIRPYLDEFTSRASDLKGIGIAIVVVTAVTMIATIEREINAIWGLERRASLLRRLLVVGLGAILGPLAIGAAVWSTNWVIEQSLEAAPFAEPAISLIRGPASVVLATFLFALLYAVLPARRVPLRAALGGGLAAALLFEAAKRGFVLYVAHVPTYQRVYGTLAVLPLFLVWVFVSWLLVLAGAAVAATLADGPVPRRRARR
ncbi:MAG TPA: YihY family inner membrane protein [Casimicrobiaceae bacterium]|nr:YihY family inner membrane protein [Casimicrobiaceae bacterium]